MSKALILTASFGMGHNSVSNAVKRELEEDSSYDEIVIKDLFEVVYPYSIYNFFIDMYKILTVKYPKIYNFLYNSRNKKNSLVDKLMYNLLVGKVNNYIIEEKPDLIISTFPMCSGYISKLKEKYSIKIPLITIVTDIVYGWEWIHKKTNFYLVPSTEVKESIINKGISPKQIYISGIPVKKDFKSKYSNRLLNNKLLIMSNVLSSIKNIDLVLYKLNNLKHLEVTIITGNDKKTYSKLKNMNLDNIRVKGYTSNMNKYMEESDLILTKPGGVTVFEAINIEIPICTFKESFGQEQNNIDFIRTNQIGRILYNEEELLKFLKIYYRDNINKSFMIKNIKEFKETFEVKEIKELIDEI